MLDKNQKLNIINKLMSFIIAIDGPAGSGKTTTAKRVAEILKVIYLDTGAMYRAVGLYVLSKIGETLDEDKIKPLLNEIEIRFENVSGERRILLNGRDISDEIRNETISQMASKVSTLKSVRDFLVDEQRRISKNTSLVAEGRDIGTVVFPHAQLKFYMDCTIDERAKRRSLEYSEKKIQTDISDIKRQIAERDERDKSRAHAPLKMADDAILIDTTSMSKEEQIQFVVAKAQKLKDCI
ncbi:TPA: (d)CMP kinase [candidate division WOR-3 bacterium]|uniref:Cytidylate kinase n=1 Tax=candidate division WOR-3 bacterium TaxID=2052148 RepID=A0A350H860_UNCW3|nr:(d)CMP kinase [candidate division WOR-3 bacterium]